MCLHLQLENCSSIMETQLPNPASLNCFLKSHGTRNATFGVDAHNGEMRHGRIFAVVLPRLTTS